MSEYVPSTDGMREDYIWRNRPRPSTETAAEFDRWLNQQLAAAWDQGWNTLANAVESVGWDDLDPDAYLNPYESGDRHVDE